MIDIIQRKITKILILFPLLFFGAQAEVEFNAHSDTLDNGLKVILFRDTTPAVVSCRLYYFVGSMYESHGTTGLSHMFEHMMFKGTERLGTKNYEKEKQYIKKIDSLYSEITSTDDKEVQTQLKKEIFSLLEEQRKYIKNNEIWKLYKDHGGTQLNAWTGDDKTAYIVTLPENRTELFHWIESDRMENHVLREFYSEKQVVLEERRMRYENRPVGKYWERLNALFYTAHPYRNPTIGWKSDIENYTRKKLESHVQKYYVPNNAVIVMAGNIDIDRTMGDIEKYFGGIERGPAKQEVVTREPAPTGMTKFTMKDDAQPRIDVLFHTPGYPDKDLYTLDVISGLLKGKTGRLYKRLVDEEEVCISVSVGNAFRLHNGYFHLSAQLKDNADPEKVEDMIFEVIESLYTDPPDNEEVMKVKNRIRKNFITGLENLEGICDQLAFFERLNSWKDMEKYPIMISKVKRDQIPTCSQKYLDFTTSTIGKLLNADLSKKK